MPHHNTVLYHTVSKDCTIPYQNTVPYHTVLKYFVDNFSIPYKAVADPTEVVLSILLYQGDENLSDFVMFVLVKKVYKVLQEISIIHTHARTHARACIHIHTCVHVHVGEKQNHSPSNKE